MAASVAEARMLSGECPAMPATCDEWAEWAAKLEALETQLEGQSSQMTALVAQVDAIWNKTVDSDNFYTNTDKVLIPKDEVKTLRQFVLRAGYTLDLLAIASTKEEAYKQNNGMILKLFQNGAEVAHSVDDGNGKDDNLAMSLAFKTTVAVDTAFELTGQVFSYTHSIPARQLQIGWKTYGPGYGLNEY